MVGFWRTHTRPGLYLDEFDLALFRDYFASPEAIALLIRPDAAGPNAGFFFWEGNDIRRSSPYEMFRLALPSVHTPSGALVPVPVAQRASFSGWRKPALLLPVAAGLAAGIFWDPTPLERSKTVNLNTQPELTTAEPRAVFEPPPFAPPPAPVVETAPYTPPPEEGVTVKAGSVPAPPQAPRKLVMPAQNRRVSEPVLDVPAPVIAAASRLEEIPVASQPLPRATAIVEPVRASGMRRAVGSIPGLGFLKRRKHSSASDYTPARPLREFRPLSPPSLSDHVPVRVRLLVTSGGEVERAELLTLKAETVAAELALDAARKWRFEPARLDEKPVASELIVQFRFVTAPRNGT
ncbi:MAG: energy transducer TonB [Bryobacteraceae bacterium]